MTIYSSNLKKMCASNKPLYFCSVSIANTMNIHPYSETLQHGVDCSISPPINANSILSQRERVTHLIGQS